MSDVCNISRTSNMGKDICKRHRRNRENAKQIPEVVTASPNINIDCRSTDGNMDMICQGVFAIQYNDVI